MIKVGLVHWRSPSCPLMKPSILELSSLSYGVRIYKSESATSISLKCKNKRALCMSLQAYSFNPLAWQQQHTSFIKNTTYYRENLQPRFYLFRWKASFLTLRRYCWTFLCFSDGRFLLLLVASNNWPKMMMLHCTNKLTSMIKTVDMEKKQEWKRLPF